MEKLETISTAPVSSLNIFCLSLASRPLLQEAAQTGSFNSRSLRSSQTSLRKLLSNFLKNHLEHKCGKHDWHSRHGQHHKTAMPCQPPAQFSSPKNPKWVKWSSFSNSNFPSGKCHSKKCRIQLTQHTITRTIAPKFAHSPQSPPS